MRSPSVMAILVVVGTDLFAAAVLPHHKHDTHSRTIAAAAFGGAGIIAAVRNWNNEKDIAAAVAEAKAEQESLLEATTATLLKAKGKVWQAKAERLRKQILEDVQRTGRQSDMKVWWDNVGLRWAKLQRIMEKLNLHMCNCLDQLGSVVFVLLYFEQLCCCGEIVLPRQSRLEHCKLAIRVQPGKWSRDHPSGEIVQARCQKGSIA
ncbi:hypothetical protein FRB94_014091 [Tulasnella sp. JGI-2019a]|nr:hypothetical protein FRB94_014091 [Tulasnella sp. JGI-2019a]